MKSLLFRNVTTRHSRWMFNRRVIWRHFLFVYNKSKLSIYLIHQAVSCQNMYTVVCRSVVCNVTDLKIHSSFGTNWCLQNSSLKIVFYKYCTVKVFSGVHFDVMKYCSSVKIISSRRCLGKECLQCFPKVCTVHFMLLKISLVRKSLWADVTLPRLFSVV